MRALVTGAVALTLLLAAGGICLAQIVVKKEPMEGQLTTGATVVVDDGTCGHGKIKLITANNNPMSGDPRRSRTCISKVTR